MYINKCNIMIRRGINVYLCIYISINYINISRADHDTRKMYNRYNYNYTVFSYNRYYYNYFKKIIVYTITNT